MNPLLTLLCTALLICSPALSADPTPAATPAAATQETGYWLSTTGKRHNAKCRYYQKTKGIPCNAQDGIACKVCGG